MCRSHAAARRRPRAVGCRRAACRDRARSARSARSGRRAGHARMPLRERASDRAPAACASSASPGRPRERVELEVEPELEDLVEVLALEVPGDRGDTRVLLAWRGGGLGELVECEAAAVRADDAVEA